MAAVLNLQTALFENCNIEKEKLRHRVVAVFVLLSGDQQCIFVP
jgi:hypothetical protein